MAENEPVTTLQEVPTQTVVREAAPAGQPPGDVPPEAPKRPGGLARWGVALVALAVVVGVVSVAAAMLAAGSGGSSIRGWLPADTVAYLELRADLPGDQRAKVGDLLAKFPGFADQSALDAKVDEALDRILDAADVSWSTDVKPWLAGEVGLAVTPAAFEAASEAGLDPDSLAKPEVAKAPDDGAVLLVAVKDAAAAEAWVSRQLGAEPSAGDDVTVVPGPMGSSVAFTVRDNVLIIGPEATVKAALATGGSSKVEDSASFQAALDTAPNAYLAFGYLDVAAFVDGALGVAGSATDLPKACLDQALAAVPPWASGSVQADADVLIFTSTTPVTGEAPATKASASAIADHLPGTTVVAVEFRDFGTALVDGIATLKEQAACDPSTAEMIDQLEQALAAIGGVEALLGWADDTAIAVTFDGGTPGGGLAATAADEAAAGRALDQVQALLALGGAGSGLAVREEPYGDGSLLIVEIPSELTGEELPTIAATAQGGVFVLGTLDFVKAVVDTKPDSSLASSPTYERAIAAAGGDGVSDVFVDVAGLVAAAETMIPADEKSRYETEAKPFLAPFEAFAAVTEAPGTTAVTRAVITFTK